MSLSGRDPDLRAIVRAFRIDGEFLDAAPYGTGHINRTFASRFRTSAGTVRFIHQRINSYVFKKPALVMENVERITAHLGRKIAAAGGDPGRETLTLVPAADGRSCHVDEEGAFWRTYVFIERAATYDLVTDPGIARQAAAAFGRFQGQLADLPGGPLRETIPDFHNTPRRFGQFLEALGADAVNRAAGVRREIGFIEARRAQASRLTDLFRAGGLAERVAHNDTKANNVMIDDLSRLAVCVIDLDTTMPGFAVCDFGECVRTGAATALEDERDLGRVGLDLGMYEALARGFLETAGGFLTPLEIDLLPFACRLMTFENGIRFLTDHLKGDVYYRIARPGHNLDRCRTQLRLVEEMERAEEAMAAIIARYRP